MTQTRGSTIFYRELTDFFNDRHPHLQKYLYWQVRSEEIAEELAQESYARYLRQTDQRGILDLNAFLFKIARNLAYDYLRSLKRQQTREYLPLDENLPDSKPATEEIIAQHCLAQQLEKAIGSLPDKTREIFLLYRADGLSYRDIGAVLNISERTVEYHLRRAIVHCRAKLTDA